MTVLVIIYLIIKKTSLYEGNSFLSIPSSRLARNGKVIAEIKRRLEDIDIRYRIRLGRISETVLAGLLAIEKCFTNTG